MQQIKKSTTMKYPIGIQDFAQIIQNGYVYVDKTDLIYKLINGGKIFFLSRPRRFGKSLLVSTLKYYFQGCKDLFKGLAIDSLEREWNTYPVLHFTMSGLKNLKVSEAKSKLENFIADYERLYGRNTEEETPGAHFRGLIHRACEKTGDTVQALIYGTQAVRGVAVMLTP